MMDEARLTKLPKWAQQYIQKLQKDTEWYKEQLRQVDTADSPLTWEVFSGNSETHGIPERATIIFVLPNGKIDFTLRKDEIRVSAHSGSLLVEPVATNSIKLSCGK